MALEALGGLVIPDTDVMGGRTFSQACDDRSYCELAARRRPRAGIMRQLSQYARARLALTSARDSDRQSQRAIGSEGDVAAGTATRSQKVGQLTLVPVHATTLQPISATTSRSRTPHRRAALLWFHKVWRAAPNLWMLVGLILMTPHLTGVVIMTIAVTIFHSFTAFLGVLFEGFISELQFGWSSTWSRKRDLERQLAASITRFLGLDWLYSTPPATQYFQCSGDVCYRSDTPFTTAPENEHTKPHSHASASPTPSGSMPHWPAVPPPTPTASPTSFEIVEGGIILFLLWFVRRHP